MNCPECDVEVGEPIPETCPSCGFPVGKHKPKRRSLNNGRPNIPAQRVAFVVGALVVLGIVGTVGSSAFSEREQAAQMQALLAEPSLDAWNIIVFSPDSKISDMKGAIELDPALKARWVAYIDQNLSELVFDESVGDVCAALEGTMRMGFIAPQRAANQGKACRAFVAQKAELEALKERNRGRLSEHSGLADKVEEAASALKVAELQLSSVSNSATHITGWISGVLGNSHYEVSVGGFYNKAVLKTVETSFTTTGNFSMYVVRDGSTQITLKNGGVVSWPLLIEQPRVADQINIMKLAWITANSNLGDARRKLRDAKQPALEDEEPFIQKNNVALAALRATLSPPTPNPTETARTDVPPKAPMLTGTTLADAICEGAGTEAECSKCPSYTESAGEETVGKLTLVLTGAVTSIGLNQRIYDLDGCASSVGMFGGTVIVEHTASGWKRRHYYPALRTDKCFGLDATDGLAVLVCHSMEAGQGDVHGMVNAFWFRAGEKRGENLFEYDDNTNACPSTHVAIGSLHGLQQRNGAVWFDFEGGSTPVPSGFEDYCQAIEQGFEFPTQRQQFSIPFDGKRFDLTQVPSFSGAADELDSILSFESDTQTHFLLMSQRLEAHRSLQQVDAFVAMANELAAAFPKEKPALLREIAVVYEESGQFKKAETAHQNAIDFDPDSNYGLGRAAWFYVTAPGEFKDEAKARTLLMRQDKVTAWAALANSELILRSEGISSAAQYLASAPVERKSPELERRLAEFQSGVAVAVEFPSELVSPLPHKTPVEWGGIVPNGALSNDERLLAAVAVAREKVRKKDFDGATALYREAIHRAEDPLTKVGIQLWLGKAMEAAGDEAEALKLYEELLLDANPRDNRPSKRMTWFLLTAKDKSLRDKERANKLTNNVLEKTQRSDPSALDNLAEYQIQSGDVSAAKTTLHESIRLDPTREYYRRRLKDFEDGKSTYMN